MDTIYSSLLKADTPAAALGKICTVAFLDFPGLNQERGGAGRDSNPGLPYSRPALIIYTEIWGNTGRVINFEVILKIVRKDFLQFFS
jgi:hypothetical protein